MRQRKRLVLARRAKWGPRIKELAEEVAREHGLEVLEMLLSKRLETVQVRHELFARCRDIDGRPPFDFIADTLGFHRNTIQDGVERYRSGKAYVAKERPLCGRCGKRVRRDGFCSARCRLGV